MFKVKKFCMHCKKQFEFDVDEFLNSGKKQVVCGECREEVLLTQDDAYDLLIPSLEFLVP